MIRIRNFFERSGDTAAIKNITVGRLKHQYEHLIVKPISNSKKLIAKPYDVKLIRAKGLIWLVSRQNNAINFSQAGGAHQNLKRLVFGGQV